ncbi:MAG: aconitase family protein [Intestinimonas sp.]
MDQGVIAGCSGGTYQNLVRAAQILDGHSIGADAFWLSCYPGSMPIHLELTKNGYIASLMASGASIRSCFCGPCFGAGMCPPTVPSPSATPPATSPTARAASRGTAKSPMWP